MLKIKSFVDTNMFKKYSLNNKKNVIVNTLNKYGKNGVESLTRATPVDTGKTASSWRYEIREKNGTFELVWLNSNRNDGVLIVALIKYGHATASGSWIEGEDFITPAMRNILKQLVNEIKTEVKKNGK